MWVKTILVLLGLAAFAAADDVISGGTLVNDMLSGIDVAVNPEDDENLSQKLANGGSEKATTIFTSQLPEDSTALENDIQADNHFIIKAINRALHSHTPHRHHSHTPHRHTPHRHTPHRHHKHKQTRAPTRRALTRAQKNDPCPNWISDKNTQEEDDKKCNDWAKDFVKFPPKGRCGGPFESFMRKHCKKACGWCPEDELSMVSKAAVAAHKHHWHHRHHPKKSWHSKPKPKPKWGKPPKTHLHHRHVPKAGQDEDLEDELNMVSKAAVAAHKKHWHHRHHPKKPKWGKPPKKHLHHRHRPHVHVPKAGQDEDLEDEPKKAAGAKKGKGKGQGKNEGKGEGKLKAAAEKAGQDEDLEDELNMVSKAAVAAHKHHWHHRHHPKKPKWGKPPKKHLHHRHRPHVHVPKAGQDEDLEDEPKKAAGAAAAAKKG